MAILISKAKGGRKECKDEAWGLGKAAYLCGADWWGNKESRKAANLHQKIRNRNYLTFKISRNKRKLQRENLVLSSSRNQAIESSVHVKN